jgi:hypothetical protein
MWSSIASMGSQEFNNWTNRAAMKKFNRQKRRDAEKERIMQREFAMNGISWRVGDAKRAGLHPLAALGANVTSYSPVHAGDQPNLTRSNYSAEFARMGQAGHNREMQKLTVERMKKENDLLQAQIDNIRKSSTGQPTQSDIIQQPEGAQIVPDQVKATKKSDPSVTAGVHAQDRYVIDKNGFLNRTYTEEISEAMESDIAYQLRDYTRRVLSYLKKQGQTSLSLYRMKSFNKFAMDLLKQKVLLPKLKSGKWAYNLNWSQWQRVKKSKKGLFVGFGSNYFNENFNVMQYRQKRRNLKTH